MDGKALACQHLIAQRLAEELSDYDLVEAEDRLFDSLMEDKRRLMLPPSEV
jgi:predicted nucleic acid-binding Zn finger protein